MSLDSDRRRVARLSKEIADLETKIADKRVRAAKEREAAKRAADAIGRSSSVGTIRAKQTEITRREKAAADHDAKAAALQRDLARKQQYLASAQSGLQRSEAAERKRQHQESERRRREDVHHVETLEQRRREALRPLIEAVPDLPPERRIGSADGPLQPGEYRYDVCLSFAGEQRGYVELVAADLEARGLRVFYDQYEKVDLWGKDLVEHLDRIYRIDSRYCVMFISREYAEKAWTRLERRSALARALNEGAEYVLPARFDDTELPGLPPTVGYIPLRDTSPGALVDLIQEKVTGKPTDG